MEFTVRQVSPENQRHTLTYSGFYDAHCRDIHEPGFSTWGNVYSKAWHEGEKILEDESHPFRRTGSPDDIFPWTTLTGATLDELWELLNGISVAILGDEYLESSRVILTPQDLIAAEFNKKLAETVSPAAPDFRFTTSRLQLYGHSQI